MKNKNSHINIFIAYAREDEDYLIDMRIEMDQIRDKDIKVWYDGLIDPGDKWNQTIKSKLHNSDVVVLLISRYSIASKYFYEIELTEALERHEKEDIIVVPIILTPCSWQNTPLSELQLLPSNATPISKWKEGKEDAWHEIGLGIRRTIENVELKKEEEKRRKKEEKRRKEEEEKRIEEEKQRQAKTTIISKKELAELLKTKERLAELTEAYNNRTLRKEEISEISELLKTPNLASPNQERLGNEAIKEDPKFFKQIKKTGIPRIAPYLLIYFISVFLTLNFIVKPILNYIEVSLGNVNTSLTKGLSYFISLEFWLTTLFSGLFIVLIFRFIHNYIKRLQTHLFVIALLSFIIGSIVVLLLSKIWLELDSIGNDRLLLFTSYISLFLAFIIVWRYTAKYYLPGIMEGGEQFDVFISYSHSDSKWVMHNLYKPLNELRKSDGSYLNIFFDEKSIGIGEAFTLKYMRALVDSKLFIPVMTKDYYTKNHCRNEMDLAVKRRVDNLIDICILADGNRSVPEEFQNLNIIDINKQNDFIEVLKRQLTVSGILN